MWLHGIELCEFGNVRNPGFELLMKMKLFSSNCTWTILPVESAQENIEILSILSTEVTKYGLTQPLPHVTLPVSSAELYSVFQLIVSAGLDQSHYSHQYCSR